MNIKSLRLINYLSHADTTISDLAPVTVLVGPNGAGKSAVFDGLHTLSRLLTGPVGQPFAVPPYSFNDRLFRGASKKDMAFEAEFGDPQFAVGVRYTIRIGFSGAENVGAPPSILDEVVKLDGKTIFDRAAKKLDVNGITLADIRPDMALLATIRQLRKNQFKGPQALGHLASRIGSVIRYRLEPRRLSMPSTEPDPGGHVRLGYEGQNLSACLYWMRENNPSLLAKVVSDIRGVIPSLKGISFNFVGTDGVGFSFEFDDARQSVLAPNASSGTLLLLGLVTLLNSPTVPEIACIEEPETGLTPDAMRLFLSLLITAATRADAKSRGQFFFSSHSPFVLVDAWNSTTADRSFIKRFHVSQGRSVVEDIQSIIDRGDSGAVLQKTSNGRDTMGLKTAEELMCGRFLPSA